ncbi:hypothetical protein [Chryseobacterium carnipullorum]|uniref:Uncharacterized protein n=2 Tax=Chryseobacterium carnipullorum TaxID=1124835 RepID=A0A376DSY3_CHRCU|nr:hypothetical protein [Chryseobacterium carnipullorum]STC94891.1 Uncharacterised protein [Chryseobacterium carnipullorum]
MRKELMQHAKAENEVYSILQNLIVGNSPEELEDMIFHVFEDANLQSGDLSQEERSLRSEFHIASRKILRLLCKHPDLLRKLKDA